MSPAEPLKSHDTITLWPPRGSSSVHLDALRGIAAIAVFLSHWRDAFFVDYPEFRSHFPLVAVTYLFTEAGHQWVIVFFVLSGFLVGNSVLHAVREERWTWRSYLLARLSRLYTVLLPALLLGGILDWLGMHLPGADALYNGRSGMYTLTHDVHTNLTLKAFLANCLFLQGIRFPGSGGATGLTFGSNVVLWSLSNEFFYYLMFPLLVLFLISGSSWRLRLICLFGLILGGWFAGTAMTLLGIPWLLGVSAGWLPAVPKCGPVVSGSAIFAALALMAGALALGRSSSETGLTDMLLAVAVVVLIWTLQQFATAPLSSKYVWLAQRAARSSFTLYVVHLPMILFLKAALHLPRSPFNLRMSVIGLGLALLVVFYAQVVYELFEKNTDHVRRWIKPYVMGKESANRKKVREAVLG